MLNKVDLVQHQQYNLSFQTTFLSFCPPTALLTYSFNDPLECHTQMSRQFFLKRPSGLLQIPGNPYPIYRPNHVCGSKLYIGSAFPSQAVLQTQSRLHMSRNMNIRYLATLHSPHQVHLATTIHRQHTQQTRRKNSWTKRFPEVHDNQVKNLDGNAVWGASFEAIVTVHRDKDRRARRVWTPFSGGTQKKKALRVKWAADEQVEVQRKLRDETEEWSED